MPEKSREELLLLIDQIVKKTMTMDLTWEWPCGVAYYGICCAYELTGRQEYLDFLTGWVSEYQKLGLPAWNVNTCAMGHTLLTLYEKTGNEVYHELIRSKISYLREDALRFQPDGDGAAASDGSGKTAGVLQHTVSSANDFPEQCWADTLFMAAFFMLRTGVMEKDQALIQDALNQYYWHIQYLQDKADGLWYHGYDHKSDSHMSGIHWGRANAWAAYTMSQVKKLLSDWYLYPQCMEVECSLRDQLAAVKFLQTENGLWRTILDDEDAYEEVSASCGIAAAMLENGNPLHRKYVEKALDGVLKNITPDGRVLNVSGGTAVMKDAKGYKEVPKSWIQGWGQGLALAFLCSYIESMEQR